ncbi:MAG: NifB/NifX family molybdenum-iron cluster-binding protein [Nitrospiraceae bacterium]|nr:MAG: NifB/NifX family molybdenum-iron cluster-binding protein [Nitrospiraceae bacterium]
MKLCISSSGKDMSSKAATHFGRAPWFLIIDTDSMNVEPVENTLPSGGRGSGVSAAQLVLDRGTAAVLTGVIGPNAFEALKIAHADIYEGLSGNETVREALDKFKKGEYNEAEVPSGGPGR